MTIKQENDDMDVDESKTPTNTFGMKSPQSSHFDTESVKSIFEKADMMTNYYRLYEKYGDCIKNDELDERFFLENNIKTKTISVTPFIRQGHANKPADQKAIKKESGIEQVADSKLTSKRLLDYNANSTNTR